jgi:hypothetical protein
MKRKFNYDEKVLKLHNFMQYLYGELLDTPKSLSLTDKLKSWEIPDYNVTAIKIIELGFVKRSGAAIHIMYSWNKDKILNLESVKEIINEVAKYGEIQRKKAKENKLIKKINENNGIFKFDKVEKLTKVDTDDMIGKDDKFVPTITSITYNETIKEIEKDIVDDENFETKNDDTFLDDNFVKNVNEKVKYIEKINSEEDCFKYIGKIMQYCNENKIDFTFNFQKTNYC